MLKLLQNLRRREWTMAAVCAVLILGQIYFDLSLPDYMSNLTVLIKTPGSTMGDILNTGLEMLGCTLASAVLCVICGYLTAKVAAGFSFSIREAVFRKIADFGQQEMMAFSVPSLINRTTNDITQVQMLVSMGLQILIKSPVMAVWAIVKIVNKSWTLSAITAGFVAALLVMMVVIIGVVVPRFRRVQKLTDHINLVARENLNGINVVHAYNAEDYQNAKFRKGNEELMHTQLFNQRAFAFLMPGVTLAMNALSLVIYWVGAAIVNAVPAADAAARLATFSDIVVFGTYGRRGEEAATDWKKHLMRRDRYHVSWPEYLVLVEILLAKKHTINYVLNKYIYNSNCALASGSYDMVEQNSMLNIRLSKILLQLDAIRYLRYVSHKHMSALTEERLRIAKDREMLDSTFAQVGTSLNTVNDVAELKEANATKFILFFISVASLFGVLLEGDGTAPVFSMISRDWGEGVAVSLVAITCAGIIFGLYMLIKLTVRWQQQRKRRKQKF